jgi:CHAT domain-containing protein
MLLIGDPVSVDPSFPALPHAGQEIDTVKRRMAVHTIRAYQGTSAHPGVLSEARPDHFRWIHFTAHASASRESPLDSAVILSPREGDPTSYKLYARDVMSTPLDAELVTVSACRGAGAREYAGEGLVGFAWAFLLAGASNVIAGVWDVTDASTAQLMDTLYAGIAADKAPAAALREAKLTMIRGGGNYAKPYYWAPFQVYTRHH